MATWCDLCLGMLELPPRALPCCPGDLYCKPCLEAYVDDHEVCPSCGAEADDDQLYTPIGTLPGLASTLRDSDSYSSGDLMRVEPLLPKIAAAFDAASGYIGGNTGGGGSNGASSGGTAEGYEHFQARSAGIGWFGSGGSRHDVGDWSGAEGTSEMAARGRPTGRRRWQQRRPATPDEFAKGGVWNERRRRLRRRRAAAARVGIESAGFGSSAPLLKRRWGRGEAGAESMTSGDLAIAQATAATAAASAGATNGVATMATALFDAAVDAMSVGSANVVSANGGGGGGGSVGGGLGGDSGMSAGRSLLIDDPLSTLEFIQSAESSGYSEDYNRWRVRMSFDSKTRLPNFRRRRRHRAPRRYSGSGPRLAVDARSVERDCCCSWRFACAALAIALIVVSLLVLTVAFILR